MNIEERGKEGRGGGGKERRGRGGPEKVKGGKGKKDHRQRREERSGEVEDS